MLMTEVYYTCWHKSWQQDYRVTFLSMSHTGAHKIANISNMQGWERTVLYAYSFNVLRPTRCFVMFMQIHLVNLMSPNESIILDKSCLPIRRYNVFSLTSANRSPCRPLLLCVLQIRLLELAALLWQYPPYVKLTADTDPTLHRWVLLLLRQTDFSDLYLENNLPDYNRLRVRAMTAQWAKSCSAWARTQQ